MRHEKILKREDGSKVKIVVKYSCDYITNGPSWQVDVYLCAPRKRTWELVVDENKYSFRALNKNDRIAEVMRVTLCHVTQEEVMGAMYEVWLQLKPPAETEREKWAQIFSGH